MQQDAEEILKIADGGRSGASIGAIEGNDFGWSFFAPSGGNYTLRVVENLLKFPELIPEDNDHFIHAGDRVLEVAKPLLDAQLQAIGLGPVFLRSFIQCLFNQLFTKSFKFCGVLLIKPGQSIEQVIGVSAFSAHDASLSRIFSLNQQVPLFKTPPPCPEATPTPSEQIDRFRQVIFQEPGKE
jgi:hypothetical protein